MLRILISDTHYGWKQNSITWLNKQMEFIYHQLIPHINELIADGNTVAVYHLGDVFDSRSSINPMVANRVRRMFGDLCRTGIEGLYIIGGNHDYYSPENDKDCAIDMVLRKDYSFDPTLMTHCSLMKGQDYFIPWYEYDNVDTIRKDLESFDIERVFVHADLTHIDEAHKELFKNVQVYSGHIHTPSQQGNLHTLGATYPLTFADCNSQRGYYILDDDNNIEFFANRQSIKFWRFYNDEIFEVEVGDTDYIELYVDQLNMQSPKYTAQISELTKRYKNLWVIPQVKPTDNDNEELETYDILEVCRSMVPEHLKTKFEQIEQSL